MIAAPLCQISPVNPAFHPVIPAFHPVIPAKAGIQTAANAPGTPANELRQRAQRPSVADVH